MGQHPSFDTVLDWLTVRAMRPATFMPGRKFFVAAELFTVGCGELLGSPCRRLNNSGNRIRCKEREGQ